MEYHSDTEPTEIAESDAENEEEEEEEEEDGRWSQALIVEWSAMLRHPFFADADGAKAGMTRAERAAYLVRDDAVIKHENPLWRRMFRRCQRTYYLESIGYALRMGWMDAAARLTRWFVTKVPWSPFPKNHGLPYQEEPVELINNDDEWPRPLMRLAWTIAAYLGWRDGDRAFLRMLCAEGILSAEMVLDMLFFASQEPPDIPFTQAMAAVMAKDHSKYLDVGDNLDQAYEILRTTSVETADQRVFCCPQRCAMMHELLVLFPLDMNATIWNAKYGEEWWPVHRCKILGGVHERINAPLLREFLLPHGRAWLANIAAMDGDTLLFHPGKLVDLVNTMLTSKYDRSDVVGWSSFSFSQMLGPQGLLATFARELRLVDLVFTWYTEVEDIAHLNIADCRRTLTYAVGEDEWFDGFLAYGFALVSVLIDFCASLQAAASDAERRTLVTAFDYDFTNWDRRAFFAANRVDYALLETWTARCDFKAVDDTDNDIDDWAETWKAKIMEQKRGGSKLSEVELSCLEYSFDPRIVHALLKKQGNEETPPADVGGKRKRKLNEEEEPAT